MESDSPVPNDAEDFQTPNDAYASFLRRRAQGEDLDLDAFCDEHPEFAFGIRCLFAARDDGVGDDTDRDMGSRDRPLTDVGAILNAHLIPGEDGSPADGVRRLGEYVLVKELGRGGMGIVYEARDELLNRTVALKVLPYHSLLSPTALERFQREAQSAARLHHPHIVPVHHVGESEGVHYYAMQLIEGVALDRVLEDVSHAREAGESGFLNVATSGSDAGGVGSSTNIASTGSSDYFRRVARLGAQVAGALSYAHAKGLIHRDIKPANLILDTHGTVWVTDFGLARGDDDGSLTQTGDVVGTLAYMPPERLDGWWDARSDVYALGLVLYELMTHRRAFAASERSQLLRKVSEEEPTPPRKVDSRIPRDLETIVLKAIAKDPARRYRSAAELETDLVRFGEGRPVAARRVGAGERSWLWCRRNPLVATLLALMLISSLTAAVVFGVLSFRLEGTLDELQATQADQRRSLHAARMQLISRAWDEQDLVRMRELLQLTRPAPGEDDLRGFPWFHFARLANEQGPKPGVSIAAHGGRVTQAVFSSTGRALITAGDDFAVRVWEPGVWHEKASKRLSARVTALAVDADCRRIAIATDARELLLWNIVDGRTEVVEGGKSRIVGVVFPERFRDSIVIGRESGVVETLDLKTRTSQPIWNLPKGMISLDYDEGSHRLLGFGSSGWLTSRHFSGGKELSAKKEGPYPLGRAMLCPDGSCWLATGTVAFTVFPVDELDSRRRGYSRFINDRRQEHVVGAFSPDSAHAAIGGFRQVFLYRTQTLKTRLRQGARERPLAELRGNWGQTICVAFSPDQQWLVAGGEDGSVRHVATGKGEALRAAPRCVCE